MLNTQLLASAKDDKSIDGGLFSKLSGASAANRPSPTDSGDANAGLQDEFGRTLTDWMGSDVNADADLDTPADIGAELLPVAETGEQPLSLQKLNAWLQQLSPDAREKLLSQLQGGNNLPATGEALAADLPEELPADLLQNLPQDLTEAEFLQGLQQLFSHQTGGQASPIEADSGESESLDAEQVMRWFDKLTSYLSDKPQDNSAVANKEAALATQPGADPVSETAPNASDPESAAKLAAALGVAGVAVDDAPVSDKGAGQPMPAQQAAIGQTSLGSKAGPQNSGQAGEFAAGAKVFDPEAKAIADGKPELKAEAQSFNPNLSARPGETAAASTTEVTDDGQGLDVADKAVVAKAKGELSFQTAAQAVEQHNRAAAANMGEDAVQAEVTDAAQLAPGEQRNALESLRQANGRHEQAQETLNMRQGQVEKALSEKMMMMLGRNMQAAEVRLDPPELGSMMIRVQVQQDQATVQFNVSNQQAREALEQALPRLREMLAQQGINLGDAEINQQQHQQGQTGGEYADSATSQQADEGEWLETELPVDNEAVSYAATGRIDYFA